MDAYYGAWIYVMKCDDHPELVKVGLSNDPVRRAFQVRKKGALLPIVEYAKQAFNPINIERRVHQSLQHCRVRGEWFKCSVSVATAAILGAVGSDGSASKGREEWIEEQAQAVATAWQGDRQIPAEMLPRVQKIREETKQRAANEAKKAVVRLAILLAVLFLLGYCSFCMRH
jgi:hypothetical protein